MILDKTRRIQELLEQRIELKDKLKAKNKVVEKCVEEVRTLTVAIEDLERKHEYALEKKEHELELAKNSTEDLVYKKTRTIREEAEELRASNAKSKAENEIMREAFKNMGFDVKDMKEILMKLVEGIASKNTVSIVK